MFGRLTRRFTWLIFCAALPAVSFSAEVQILSKSSEDDASFRAYVLPVANEDRIVIRRTSPRDIAELSLLSQDSMHGAKVEHIAWSGNARYLVFTTTSSGGHSPWNHRTYVFSTRHWAFLTLDDAVAPVTSADFTFPDASHVEIEIMRPDGEGSDDTVKKTVDLDALPWPAKPAESPAPENAESGK